MAARVATITPITNKRPAGNMSLRIRDELNPLGHSLLDLRQSYGEDGNCGSQPQRHTAHRFLVPGPFLGCLTFELLHPKLAAKQSKASKHPTNFRLSVLRCPLSTLPGWPNVFPQYRLSRASLRNPSLYVGGSEGESSLG